MDAVLLQKARRHLSRDAIMKPLIRGIGPCTLKVNGDHFDILVRSIVSQQISGKAAAAISGRLLKTVRRFRPANILKATDAELRAAGLSGGKQKSLRDLATKCDDGLIPLKKLADMEDADIIASLTQVHGIGPWTAEMFLIFSLGRTDILPVGDYGLRAGVQKHYQLAELPKKQELIDLTEQWKPFRSIGTWYIWRSLGGVPEAD
jgi:DNA-3-methyladenine glycosylase II